jgi:hypothetical protein
MLFADDGVIATTPDGRTVILKSDYTWQYSLGQETDQEAEPQQFPMTVLDFEIIPLSKNYDLNRFSDEVVLLLSVRNDSGKKITGYRLFITVANAFGDHLRNLQLTCGDSVLEPGAEDFPEFLWEDNQFIDDEVFDDLVSFSKTNLRLTLTDVVVVFAS